MIQLIRLEHPDFPKLKSSAEVGALIDLWTDIFGEYDSKVVRHAVNNFLRTNPYEPKIADIQAEIDKLIGAVDDQTVEACIKESWEAICGNRKFEALSPISREYWGSQQAIDAVGFDESTTYSVIAGQMQRRLPAIKARQNTRREMSPELESTIGKMLKGVIDDVCDDVSLLRE